MAGAIPAANGEARKASPRMPARDPNRATVRISGADCTILSSDLFKASAGLGLAAGPTADVMAVALVRRDGRPEPLFSLDEAKAVAQWRSIARDAGLTLMLGEGEVYGPVRPQLGPVLLGEVRIRRRHGLLKGRRPRFLTRRKTGALPLRPVIHQAHEVGG